MSDTRFTAEYWLDRKGYLVGAVRIPKQREVVLEALADIISRFSIDMNVPFDQVLKDIWHYKQVGDKL